MVFIKGFIPWNKGKGKNSRVCKCGNKKTFYAVVCFQCYLKKGMTSWNKGKHPEYMQGKNHPMYGTHPVAWNKGTKGVVKAWNKGINGYTTSLKGRKRSIEFGKKISEMRKIRIKNGEIKIWNKGKKTGIIPRSAFKKGIYTEAMRRGSLAGAKTLYERRPTSIEVKLYEELKRRGLSFETQKIINGKFCVDAYIPSLNLIIEADGNYWHGLEKTVKKDRAENAYLKTCGFNLLRLSEAEINNTNFGKRIG